MEAEGFGKAGDERMAIVSMLESFVQFLGKSQSGKLLMLGFGVLA